MTSDDTPRPVADVIRSNEGMTLVLSARGCRQVTAVEMLGVISMAWSRDPPRVAFEVEG
jgi:hypothetical protein